MLYLFAQLPFFPWPRHKVRELGPDWHLAPELVGNGPFLDGERRDGPRRVPAKPVLAVVDGRTSRSCRLTCSTPVLSLAAWDERRFDFLMLPDFLIGDLGRRPPSRRDARDLVRRLQHSRPVRRRSRPEGVRTRGRPAPARSGRDEHARVRRVSSARDAGPLARPLSLRTTSSSRAPFSPKPVIPTLAAYPSFDSSTPIRGSARTCSATSQRGGSGRGAELGVRIRQDAVPFEAFRDEVAKPGSIASWGWSSDYPDPDGLLSTFLISHAAVAPDEVTALVERARASQDRDARLELFREADRVLVAEQIWIVPVLLRRVRRAASRERRAGSGRTRSASRRSTR